MLHLDQTTLKQVAVILESLEEIPVELFRNLYKVHDHKIEYKFMRYRN